MHKFRQVAAEGSARAGKELALLCSLSKVTELQEGILAELVLEKAEKPMCRQTW